MSFEEPEPFLEGPGDFGIEVGRALVVEFVRFVDRGTSVSCVDREPLDQGGDMVRAGGRIDGKLWQNRVFRRHPCGPERITSERRDPLSDLIHEVEKFSSDFVKQKVKLVKVFPFHIPMGLFRLARQVEHRR